MINTLYWYQHRGTYPLKKTLRCLNSLWIIKERHKVSNTAKLYLCYKNSWAFFFHNMHENNIRNLFVITHKSEFSFSIKICDFLIRKK